MTLPSLNFPELDSTHKVCISSQNTEQLIKGLKCLCCVCQPDHKVPEDRLGFPSPVVPSQTTCTNPGDPLVFGAGQIGPSPVNTVPRGSQSERLPAWHGCAGHTAELGASGLGHERRALQPSHSQSLCLFCPLKLRQANGDKDKSWKAGMCLMSAVPRLPYAHQTPQDLCNLNFYNHCSLSDQL